MVLFEGVITTFEDPIIALVPKREYDPRAR